jgi:hypothetical protein
VFKWLPKLRPYKGHHEVSWTEFVDQSYLVTHIAFTMNNWGELRLEPELFPHEYFFLRNNMVVHIANKDIHLVGEFVEVLRSFGDSDEDPLIQQGMEFLLSKQADDGSWDKIDEKTDEAKDDYTVYHATMVGIQVRVGPAPPRTKTIFFQLSATLVLCLCPQGNNIVPPALEFRCLHRHLPQPYLKTCQFRSTPNFRYLV